MKLYISRKKNLSDFHCFLLHKKILNTFEVIALLLKADIIFGNFSVNVCLIWSRYSIKNNFFNKKNVAIGSNSLKKVRKQPSRAIFGKKNEENTKKRPK